ncbi:hypothetical protein SAMN05443633_103319 [Chryseobacterium arachidis]|uniref:HEAT repeat-containing protein n=1 Tax=Chryseobacterium arachidis TaxID=1416778 RepID=A0A1M5A0T2_9FLAO|nr:hypothetical protein [Chryseobacterium arachidis]SHF23542.1 hypothetical protein SAMN05443633_103319 [Chryseobacterium arachidis]
MLKTTSELIEYLKLDHSERESTVIFSLVYSILQCGGKTDADEILKQCLIDPFDFHYTYLLPVFKAFGDLSLAEKLFKSSIRQNKLMEDTNYEILEVLGHLKYEPVKPILADYTFGNQEKNDYYLSRSAILGLLHFDCTEYQKEIETEIEKCYGQGLFPEFIPALVCKLKDRTLILEKLYELGSEFASTDCNAGIILSFSLCGEEGREYFKKVLFDRDWETSSTGTGTVHFAYQGLKNLDITFKELYQEIKTVSDKEELKYYLDVFFALLRIKVNDIAVHKKESFAEIYTTLFKWNQENDNIIDLARKVDLTDEAYQIKDLIKLKMNEEAILKNYIG